MYSETFVVNQVFNSFFFVQSLVFFHMQNTYIYLYKFFFFKLRQFILKIFALLSYIIQQASEGRMIFLALIVAHATFPTAFITFLIQGTKKLTLVKTWGYLGLLQSSFKVKAVIPTGFLLQRSGPPESP